MVFHAAGRRLHAFPVRRPVGRQLFRTQLDPVRAQQVPSRTRAVRRAAAAAVAVVVSKARGGCEKALVHCPGETRETFWRQNTIICPYSIRVQIDDKIKCGEV